jgi:alpha-tubulin suppressor-like RCC1 family protein
VSGTLRCWGDNLHFQAGVEALTQVAVPTVVLPGARFLQVASGATHGCALRTNGIVYCWGDGQLGALGRGDTVSSVIPQPIAANRQFSQVSAGRWRSCAVATDASLWCWGSEWESADGNTDYFHERLLPHRIAGVPAMRSVSVAGSSICGVTVDDRALCWESNSFGQLGIGSLQGTATPAFVLADEALATVSAGIVQSCALTRGGRALCWGNDTFGQLGIPRTGERCGDLECRKAPGTVFGGQRFVVVSTGPGSHTCGVTTTSALLCWGLGSEGQLGDGWTRERQSLPVGVLAPSP